MTVCPGRMAQQALHDAEARVDQLQQQRNEACDAWRANPSSDIEKACCESLDLSLHSAEEVLEKLAAAASTSGRQLWLAFPLTNNFAYCCMG